MKIRNLFPALIVALLAYISCQMPQGTSVLSDSSDLPAAGGETVSLSIETDTGRNQGVYVNEKGIKFAIRSVEYPEGTVVNCVEAIDITMVNLDEFSGKAQSGDTWVKAIVIGKRDDGNPGAWEIHNDDSIHPLRNGDAGAETSLLFESLDRDEGLRGRFGWVYYATAISDDGKMIVGYAENRHGHGHSRWSVASGTTVGVYWLLGRPHYGRFFGVSRARVIGILGEPDSDFFDRPRPDFVNRLLRHILDKLKLFFFNWLDTYLTMADSVYYDPAGDVYVVSGTDQDGRDAIATIGLDGTITITPVGGVGPDLVISSISVPAGQVAENEPWELGATVKNIGDATASGSTLNYYQSGDTALDSTDILIGSSNIPEIAAGNSYSDIYSTAYSISDAGTYYIIVVADATLQVAESNEENNQENRTVTVVAGGFDLAPGEITFTGNYIGDGRTLAIALPVNNLGYGSLVDDFIVKFYLSQTSAFNPSLDRYLGQGSVTEDIPGNSGINLNFSADIPELNVNECVYIYAVVDPVNSVMETDETNNQSTTNSAAVVLVYDDEASAPRSYNLIFETYPSTGTIINNDPDTLMTLYNNAGGVEFTQVSQNGAGNYERRTYAGSSGTYWVLIYGFVGDGPYAFSVRTSNIAQKTFGADLGSNAEDQEEAGNYPGSPPVADWVDIKVGAASNRYSGINDADWFKIVLP